MNTTHTHTNTISVILKSFLDPFEQFFSLFLGLFLIFLATAVRMKSHDCLYTGTGRRDGTLSKYSIGFSTRRTLAVDAVEAGPVFISVELLRALC